MAAERSATLDPAAGGGQLGELAVAGPGVWNERLGWLLLLAGLCTAVGLDPWSLSERDPAALPGSVRMAVRHAQAVVLAMGFLQIAVALLLREDTLPERLRHRASLVLLVGTL